MFRFPNNKTTKCQPYNKASKTVISMSTCHSVITAATPAVHFYFHFGSGFLVETSPAVENGAFQICSESKMYCIFMCLFSLQPTQV